ncbi:MAG: AAA family ATPase [Muricauda sp.]|nr:AAA family ATPase [Allomuricauda sp.]MBA4745711.1 AAA family ATPase [Allomuricauda sp.]
MNQPKLKDYSLLNKDIYYYPDQVYLSYYEKIPSNNCYRNLDFKKLIREFPKIFEDEILNYHRQFERTDETTLGSHLFILKNEILVYLNSTEFRVLFQKESTKTQNLEEFCLKLKKKKTDLAQINLIILQDNSFQNRKIDFKIPEINLDYLYNDGFNTFHEKVLSILSEKNSSGLHLFYGMPGTGKSTYIRYLCGILEKKVIFLPGQLAQNLDNVYMMRYLISNSNSILIIEDAEELIVSRDDQRNSNLAMILNLTDGILGESLKIQIIATFNTDLKKIDPALKRKGRLKSSYEFKPLTSKKANRLLKNEGENKFTDTPLTLAEIFNSKEDQQMKEPKRKAVGFR